MLFVYRLLYDLFIRVYYLAAWVMANLFQDEKAKAWIEGRKQLWHELEKINHDKDVLWFHCASVGEYEQAKPLITATKEQHPGYAIAVSFFSPSGYEALYQKGIADYVFYLPFDFKKDVKRFLDRLQPKAAFIIKYEFWYHLLYETSQRNIPLFSICSFFSEQSIHTKWYGGLHRSMLHYFDHLFVQDEASKNILSGLGLKHVTVSGDTRFDRVYELAQSEYQNTAIEQFIDGKKVLIAGSSWADDEKHLVPLVKETLLQDDHKFIFAPHVVNPSRIAELTTAFGNEAVLLSEAELKDPSPYKVLIIDSYGILSRVYRYANIAYIGAGFNTGIHNILEPVVYGLPVIFGPNYKRFKEACDLVEQGGAFSIDSTKKLKAVFKKLQDTAAYQTASTINKKYAQENIGATGKIMDYLSNNLF